MTTATLDVTSPVHRAATAGRHRIHPDVSARSCLLAGVAVGAASAVAFAPLIMPTTTAGHRELAALAPAVSRTVELAAVVSNDDIAALVEKLNAGLGSVSTTVNSVISVPGQTLDGALTSAVALNEQLWDGLLDANDNPVLRTVLAALKSSSTGGLTRLADTVGAANGTIVLTTGEVANIVTSTLTGSLGTALQAVTHVVANPLAVAGYTGLLTAPLDIAGGVLTGALSAVNHLGANGLTLADSLVHGVTAQVGNALSLVNGLLNAAEGVTDFALVDGVLTAVQGIVSAPVTATIAGVNGLSSTITDAAATTLDHLTTGAARLVTTWLGNGTAPGAVQTAITAIGSAPLSPASYSDALGALVGAGITSGRVVASTAGAFASLPFSVASGLTGTAAGVITALSSGLATFASGILQGAGMGPLISNLPYAVSTAVNGAVKIAATVTQAALNTVTTLLNAGSALTGARTATTARTAADLPELAASPHTVTLSTPKVPTSQPTAGHAGSDPVATADEVGDLTATAQKDSDTPPRSTSPDAGTPQRPAVASPPPADTSAVAPEKSAPATGTAPATPTAATTTHTEPSGDVDAAAGPRSTPRHGTTPAATAKTPVAAATHDRDSTQASGRKSTTSTTGEATSGHTTSTSTSGGAHRRDGGPTGSGAAGPASGTTHDQPDSSAAGTSKRSAGAGSHGDGVS